MQRKKITVYTGPSVSTGALIPRLRESFRGAAIHQTRAGDIDKPDTLDSDTLAFFLPGIVGEDSPYNRDPGQKGNEAIRRYVEDGGVFVGICAGAYYSCREIVYNPPWRREPKTGKPGLDFFNALAKGPLPGLGMRNGAEWFSGCRVASLSYKDKTKQVGVAYGNGPAMFPFDAESGIEIIARYEDMPDRPIAIAIKKIGKGLAIFMGALPYIGYDAQYDATKIAPLKRLMEELKPHEKGRAELWDAIVSLVKQHSADLGRVTLRPKEPIL